VYENVKKNEYREFDHSGTLNGHKLGLKLKHTGVRTTLMKSKI